MQKKKTKTTKYQQITQRQNGNDLIIMEFNWCMDL